jgi:TRAP-type C4-dicarboxylate transport system permease small subunit
MGSFIKCVDRVILGTLKVITITSFVILTILISANVFVRFVPIASLHWFDEIIELVYAYLVFYGAAALWITRGHISVGDWIEERIIKNVRTRYFYRMTLELLVLFFTVIFFYYSLRLTILALDVTNVFAIPKRILYSCLPISGAIMVIYTLRNIVVELACMTKTRQEEGEDVTQITK